MQKSICVQRTGLYSENKSCAGRGIRSRMSKPSAFAVLRTTGIDGGMHAIFRSAVIPGERWLNSNRLMPTSGDWTGWLGRQDFNLCMREIEVVPHASPPRVLIDQSTCS